MTACYAILALFPILFFVVTLAALVVPATTLAEATRLQHARAAFASAARSSHCRALRVAPRD